MFNWFRKRNKKTTENPIVQEKLTGGISNDENAFFIAVDKQDRVMLRISIQHTSDSAAETFAKALFGLQSGLYKDQISEMLLDIEKSDNNEIRIDFLNRVIEYYEIYFDMAKKLYYNKEDKPVVSPLKFSSLVHGEK